MKKPGRRRFKRPVAVTLAGSIALAVAAFHIYHGLNQLLSWDVFARGYLFYSADLAMELILRAWKNFIELGLSLLALVILLGFFRLRRWSWVFLVLWVTINIVVDLMTYFYSNANFLSMIVNVTVAFSVLQDDVQAIFGIRKPEENNESAF